MLEDDDQRELLKRLREKIKQMRMGQLFEEPCPLYEPDWDDEGN